MAQVEGAPHGLRSMAEVPSLDAYVRDLWRRREFTQSLATGSLRGQHLDTTLGNLWHVLNPALSMAVYYLVFGVLIGTSRGLDNFIGFLAIGIFTFGFAQRTITACGSSIQNNIALIRSLQFPRAVLPIATVVEQLSAFGFSAIVIVAIMFLTGEPLSASWLLAPVIVALLAMFCAGAGMAVARVTDSVRDVANVLPFAFRLLFYLSGIIFALPAFLDGGVMAHIGLPASAAAQVRHAFVLNPFFTYIELLRDVLMAGYSAEHPRDAWIAALVIAPVTFASGLLYFRSGEKTYGRG